MATAIVVAGIVVLLTSLYEALASSLYHRRFAALLNRRFSASSKLTDSILSRYGTLA
jgi:hypothetical protein